MHHQPRRRSLIMPTDLAPWDPELRHGFAPATESDYAELCSEVTDVFSAEPG